MRWSRGRELDLLSSACTGAEVPFPLPAFITQTYILYGESIRFSLCVYVCVCVCVSVCVCVCLSVCSDSCPLIDLHC